MNPENWCWEPHIPHGSGDAEHRIIDRETGTVIATIDPNMVLEDPGEFARFIVEACRRVQT